MKKIAILAVLAAAAAAACARPAPAGRKVLYYRSPMDARQTSPVPAKDSMGMDFVPVYADETASAAGAAPAEPGAFRVSPERLQTIGVKTAVARPRELFRTLRTAARVAYDPELYRTEEEYLAALSAARAARASTLPGSAARSQSLLDSSRLRLRLQGLTAAQIGALATAGRPDRTLLLSGGKAGAPWMYADVYESDLPYARRGAAVAAVSPSLPGEVFRGTVA